MPTGSLQPRALDGAEQACILECFRLSQCFTPKREEKMKISLWGFSKGSMVRKTSLETRASPVAQGHIAGWEGPGHCSSVRHFPSTSRSGFTIPGCVLLSN